MPGAGVKMGGIGVKVGVGVDVNVGEICVAVGVGVAVISTVRSIDRENSEVVPSF